MLIQIHTGIIRAFPAMPSSWKDVSFEQLRTEGAFLISAERKNGRVKHIEIISEKGGVVMMYNLFENNKFTTDKNKLVNRNGEILLITLQPNETIVFKEN